MVKMNKTYSSRRKLLYGVTLRSIRFLDCAIMDSGNGLISTTVSNLAVISETPI